MGFLKILKDPMEFLSGPTQRHRDPMEFLKDPMPQPLRLWRILWDS